MTDSKKMATDWSKYKSASYFILLESMKSIAEHSIFVHKSVSYLDLSLCEFSSSKNGENEPVYSKKSLIPLRFKKRSFICSQESSKKYLVKNRKLLYIYDLAVPTENEDALAILEKREEFECYYDGVLLHGVVVSAGFYEKQLHEMIVGHFSETNDVKFVLSVLKLTRFVKFPGKFVPSRCLDILSSHCNDSDTVKELSALIRIEESDLFFLKPKTLEFILRHSGSKDCNDPEFHRRQEWINKCISSCCFKHIELLLKFYNAPRFSESSYKKIKNSLMVSSGLHLRLLEEPVTEGWITKERNFLILQILDVFYSSQFFFNSPLRIAGIKALGMVWNAIPDILISLEELVLLFKDTKIARDIDNIHAFYSDIVKEDALGAQPRKLKDYCRIRIRNVLSRNQKLPDGIDQLKVSSVEKSFLKLGKTWL